MAKVPRGEVMRKIPIVGWGYRITGSLMLVSMYVAFCLLAVGLESIANVLAVAGYILLALTVALRFIER